MSCVLFANILISDLVVKVKYIHNCLTIFSFSCSHVAVSNMCLFLCVIGHFGSNHIILLHSVAIGKLELNYLILK